MEQLTAITATGGRLPVRRHVSSDVTRRQKASKKNVAISLAGASENDIRL